MDKSGRRLSIEQCRVFVAVCDAQSFSLAAETLLRTQSAVTHQIRALEEILGESLFLRSRGHFRGLTDAGKDVEPYARRILALVSELCALSASPSCSGTVRLGVMDDFSLSGLTQVIARFEEGHPGARVTTTSDTSSRLEDRLRQGELDLVLTKSVVEPDQAPPPEALTVERLAWVARPGFDWTQTELPLVAFHEGCVYRRLMLSRLQRAGTPWRIAYTGQSYANVREAISAGLGLSVLPMDQMSEEHRICNGDVTAFDLPTLGFSVLKLNLIGDGATAIVRAFRRVLETSLPKKSGDPLMMK